MPESDGTITLSIRDFDIVANGETEEEAVTDLAEFLIDYAEDYLNDYSLYSRSPNRRSHLPFIMNIFLQDDVEGVKQLITCLHGEK
ncbi:hypothetical protein [Gracilibacillus alcaliphilus]|uniref:hypothetical protein n=1 Tax=Gracilibacillus alcaliphilus TaxID=1401441 RepID=UPI00195AA3AB|nr:hypothetical protein [Gracilibacillus alcaliphilus]MBM7675748.1 uncharacterized protein (DUF3820 family) [Gracilibacillus alcaliphilus]